MLKIIIAACQKQCKSACDTFREIAKQNKTIHDTPQDTNYAANDFAPHHAGYMSLASGLRKPKFGMSVMQSVHITSKNITHGVALFMLARKIQGKESLAIAARMANLVQK